MAQIDVIQFIRNLPKVELHIHLEGAIPVKALWNLIVKYDGNKNINSLEELHNKFKYEDFPHFIETWIWKNKFLREYEDFTFIAKEVAGDLKDQNIKYVEMFYTPSDHFSKNIEVQKLTEAIRLGFNYYSNEIEIFLIADLCRDAGPENGMRIVHQLRELKDKGIVGIGIGGSEHRYPPGPFEKVYEKAREFGFRTTAHAGEAAGADSIWDAINRLKTDRIGHGTRAFEEDKLVEYLKENQTPLEMCPISNIRTGVVKNIKEHPLENYYKKGLNVFVNTDDPKMFNNSMEEEYLLLMEECGFKPADIKKLIQNAINSAWCENSKKQRLISELNEYLKL